MNVLLNENSLREMMLAEGEKVLDVGCGLGQLGEAIRGRVTKSKVLGIDPPVHQQLAAAREFTPPAKRSWSSFAKAPRTTCP